LTNESLFCTLLKNQVSESQMKQLLIASLLLFFSISSFAQQPGTIDPNFATDGRYTLAVTGNEAWLNFLTYQTFQNGGESSWALLAGGNIFKDYMSNGMFLTEFTGNSNPTEWQGKPPTNFTNLQDAIYTPDGRIIAVGAWENNGQNVAKVAQFTAPGIVDTDFGSSGSLNLDNQTGFDYAYGICYNNYNPKDPYYMVVGSSQPGTYDQKRAWWMLDGNGAPNTAFGNNGKFVPESQFSSAWLWDVKPYGPVVAAAGSSDSHASLSVFDPFTQTLQSFHHPQSPGQNDIYDFFTVNWDQNNFYLPGYHYNMTTDISSGQIVIVDQQNFAQNPDPFGGFSTAFNQISTQHKAQITGICNVMPAIRPPVPGALKSDDPDVMILTGSLIAGDGPETTFIAAVNPDGSLAEDFGRNGVTTITLAKRNWPVDTEMTEDGSFFVAVNETGTTHIYRFYGYTDRSGIEDQELLSNQVEVYPNPAEGNVHFELSIKDPQTINWSVLNTIGQEVAKGQEIISQAGKFKIDLSVEGWQSGIYIFKSKTSQNDLLGKFSVK